MIFTTAIIFSAFAGASVYAADDCANLFITSDVVALSREPNGRLSPVRIGAEESLRSVVPLQKDNWQSARESVVVPLEVKYGVRDVTFGARAKWLPRALRKLLGKGARFETTSDPARASEYSLWMIAQPAGHRRRGRTGVLLHNGRPVVVKDPGSGNEYLLELKGPGLPTGGYVLDPNWRALQGGLWAGQGREEFDRLEWFGNLVNEDAVRGLAHGHFAGAHGRQDILYRLTPGNLRASYRGPASLARSSAQMARLMTSLGQRVGDLLASDHFAYTHSENFVTSRDGAEAWMTDMLDALPLTHLPRFIEGVWIDETRAVISALALPRLFPDYEEAAHWPIFWRAVVDRMIARGRVKPSDRAELLALVDVRASAPALLKLGLAERIFTNRLRTGYHPLDDVDLAAAVDAPCAHFDERAHGRMVLQMFEALRQGAPQPPSAQHFEDLLGEVAQLIEGKVTFREWLLLPLTEGIVIMDNLLNLGESYLPPETDLGGDMFRQLTRDALPSWLAYRRHLEREYRLIRYALHSHPADARLLTNRDAILRAIERYTDMELEDLLRIVCDDKPRLRAEFTLPYHARR